MGDESRRRTGKSVDVARDFARATATVLALALTTSWVQLALTSLSRDVFGVFSWKWMFRDQLFLSTLGYVVLFLVVSLVPVLIHVALPNRYRWPAFFATLAAFGSFCVLLVFERISPYAWLVVAAAIGVQLHRAISRHEVTAWRWTRRVAFAGIAMSVAAVAGLGQWRAWVESAAVRSLPSAPSGAPNVVLLILDTVRAKSLSLYGTPQETTPSLQKWASRGVVFDAAYSTTSWTLPSHASMFTGQYPSLVSADRVSPLDTVRPTLAEAFRDRGYATAGFVANIDMAGYHTGLARGFGHYQDTQRTLQQMMVTTTLLQTESGVRAVAGMTRSQGLWRTLRATIGSFSLNPAWGLPQFDDKSAEQVTSAFWSWLPAAQGRPFFAFLNFFDAHDPYRPPMRYRTMFDPKANAIARYMGAIRYIDDTIDEFLRELERRGLLGNTIVIVSSDHGELFGEHGLSDHGNALYRPQLHVPLVVLNAPGAAAGTRVRRIVSLRDLPLTILDLASIPNALGIGGTSLRPLLAGGDSLPQASPVIAELSRGVRNISHATPFDLKALIADSLHVIRSSEGALQVFAWPRDSAEADDLAGTPAVASLAESRLRRVLEQLHIDWRQ